MNTLVQTTPIRFDLHSISVSLEGKIGKTLAFDFDYFTNRIEKKGNAKFHLKLQTEERAIDPSEKPNAPATKIFPECIKFEFSQKEVFQYGDDLLLTVERDINSCTGTLVSQNTNLAIEISYLFLQTEIGKFLDQMGLHRIHALGIANKNNHGAIFLLPSGGGKSSLAKHLVSQEGIRLFSDDCPIIDRLGRLRPFPLSLSFKKGTNLPNEWKERTREFSRRKHGDKILVSTLSLSEENLPRPTDKAPLKHIFIGIRHGTLNEPKIVRSKKSAAALPLFRDLVVGLGLPQVVELVLSNGAKSLIGLTKPALSRSLSMSSAIARAKVYEIHLSDNSEKNANHIIQFMNKENQD
ncbi:MAG: hypothetical protein M9962_00965 [Oligoflexia bacterium]|nr:hypothetical protein [Oligoflexia bacterium]